MILNRGFSLELREAFSLFWGKHPALFLALSTLLGTALFFRREPLLALVFLLLCSTARNRRTLLISLVCFIAAFSLTAWRYPPTVLSQEKVQGTGTFHIEQVKVHSSPFNRSILYRGTLKKFVAEDGTAYAGLPCNLFFPLYGKRPPASTDYEIAGTLSQKGDYSFLLKTQKGQPLLPVDSGFNLAEWRFTAKQAVFKHIKNEVPDPHARTFLHALATGEIDERIMTMEFGKVGLQHILAISGFHFALAALFLNFLFRRIFPDRVSALLLIASLSFYYLFLGNAPSIQRAYIAITVVTAGSLFSLRTSGLNALGAAMLVEILLDPLVVTYLSFQLTFLCTLAILLCYPVVNTLMNGLLPILKKSDALQLSLFDKHGYILSQFLRKALALNFAVHLISLPVLLHLFHKFPLLSIAYNLLFPVAVSLSLLLLFTGFLLAPLAPFLSHAIDQLNSAWTSFILNLIASPPALLDFSLRTKQISFSFVICFLFAAFVGAVAATHHFRSESKT